MKIFISWSGDLSQRVAVTLRKHLPLMIQSLNDNVFMSEHDIGSGTRWANALSQELDQTSFGVLCLTKESLSSPWLQFEAGALVKHADGRACGLLIGNLAPADITGPLSQFQHRRFERDDVLHLLKDINSRLETPLPTESLSAMLLKWWPDVESEYNAALSTAGTPKPHKIRQDRELLEEIIVRLRTLDLHFQSDCSPAEIGTGDVLARPITYDSLGWYTLWKFPGRTVSEQIQAILFRDIDRTKYRTIEDLDKVVDRARPAVERYASENPDWFRYGTDFITKSLGLIDLEFRARHGFAARTLKAFELHQGLIS
ncbi:MAG: toll/interleukin-1 receptor domain-containing protein [Candidatus Competibacteraceae bacterium]